MKIKEKKAFLHIAHFSYRHSLSNCTATTHREEREQTDDDSEYNYDYDDTEKVTVSTERGQSLPSNVVVCCICCLCSLNNAYI